MRGAAIGGSIQTIGADVAPPQARGLFLGLWRFTGQVGQTLSPIAFAFLASSTGYGSSFVFVAAAAAATALLLITLIPETGASGTLVLGHERQRGRGAAEPGR